MLALCNFSLVKVLFYGTASYHLFWCVAHAFGVLVQAGVLEELQVNLATAAQYLMDCRTAPGLYVARVSRSTCPLALYKDMNTSTFHHNITFQHADALLLMAPEWDTEWTEDCHVSVVCLTDCSNISRLS